MPTHNGTNRTKVLHIIGDSQYGGIVRIILGLGQVAKALGWEVDVLATDTAVQESLRRQSLGVVNLDVIRRDIRPFWDLAGLLRLRSFLRREGYSIVHTHTSKGGFVGRLAAWLAGVPIIVHTMHGFAIHEQSPAWARIVYSALERLASRWCHRIVSVSEFHRRWALELNICAPAQIQAIPNGITPPALTDHFEPAELRRQLGVGEGDLLILCPARLAVDKGLEYLVEAAALLPRGGPGFRVVIAGDGPTRGYLERLARDLGVSDIIRFLGFRQDIAELLAISDLVVLPSLREGLSMSLLEAMAAGKPIIATSIGSQRELGSQAEMALLVPPASPAALAGAIQRFAGDPALMARLAATGRALFAARYTEDKMLNGYRQLYRRLLNRMSQSPAVLPCAGGPSVVRNATMSDLTGIVTIHQKAFNQFFLTRMGRTFLRRYYELVLNYHSGIVLVSERQGVIDGFVCGFTDPAEFYRSMWRNRLTFALPALAALLRHPSLGANMIQAIWRIQTSATQRPKLSCELSSIAVLPEASGNGLGRTLLTAFLDQSWAKHAQCVYLTTDAEGNNAANALYRDIGFQHSRRFLQKKGRWMNEYAFHRALAEEQGTGMNELRNGPEKHPLRRSFDLMCGAVGLLFLSPVFAVLALQILVRDGRPVLFSQMRVGQYGVQFRIWKFRTMRAGAAGRAITAAGDGRITGTGAWLRRFKLDELPQLFNVLRGDMSLVGPRPEVPEYVNTRSPMWQAILQVAPGITDLATLLYRDEEELLGASSDADRFYREVVLPDKLSLNLAYLRTRSFWKDIRLIWLTVRFSLSPEQLTSARIRRAFITGVDYGGYLHSVSSAIDR